MAYCNISRIGSSEEPFKVGDVLISARTDLDDKWQLCNGEVIDKTTYPQLNDKLSQTFDIINQSGSVGGYTLKSYYDTTSSNLYIPCYNDSYYDDTGFIQKLENPYTGTGSRLFNLSYSSPCSIIFFNNKVIIGIYDHDSDYGHYGNGGLIYNSISNFLAGTQSSRVNSGESYSNYFKFITIGNDLYGIGGKQYGKYSQAAFIVDKIKSDITSPEKRIITNHSWDSIMINGNNALANIDCNKKTSFIKVGNKYLGSYICKQSNSDNYHQRIITVNNDSNFSVVSIDDTQQQGWLQQNSTKGFKITSTNVEISSDGITWTNIFKNTDYYNSFSVNERLNITHSLFTDNIGLIFATKIEENQSTHNDLYIANKATNFSNWVKIGELPSIVYDATFDENSGKLFLQTNGNAIYSTTLDKLVLPTITPNNAYAYIKVKD